MSDIKRYIDRVLEYLDTHGLYPDLRIIQSGANPEVFIGGRKVLMFSSNNYLGLATHPTVVAAAVEAVKKYGVGADGSRMLSGNLQVHRDFELAIAKFKGGEDAIVWPSGYSANLGVISAIMNPPKIGVRSFFNRKSIIFSDSLNHASIIDGCRMSGQRVFVYKHCDVSDLKRGLKKYAHRRKLVVTDSVFSMDGDVAPLNKIVLLCKQFNAMLMVDEAHATGVQGNTGHGTLERFGLKAGVDVDVVLGTCSKALAATGGFVVGSAALIRYLRVTSRSYIFSTAMTPAASASLIAGLSVIENEPWLREKVLGNAQYLRDGLKNIGFNTLSSDTQIIPILIGSDEDAIKFSKQLFGKGIFGPAVRWPAVGRGEARIRVCVMATHTKEHLDYFLECCKEIGQDLRLL